jgi:hypothetical protein
MSGWLDIHKMADGHEMADKDEDTTVQNVTARADCETEDEDEREGASNGRSKIIRQSDSSEIMLKKCSECLESTERSSCKAKFATWRSKSFVVSKQNKMAEYLKKCTCGPKCRYCAINIKINNVLCNYESKLFCNIQI